MSKKNKNTENKAKNQVTLKNGQLIQEKEALYINNPDYFLTFSDLEVSDGIDIIENIMIMSNKHIANKKQEHSKINEEKLIEITEDYKNKKKIDGGYISQNFNDLDYFINSYEDISIINVMANDIEIQDFTQGLKVANSQKGFVDARIDLGQIILINKALSPKLLIQLYKVATKQKAKFFESLNLPIHIKNILNKNDFLVIGTNLPEESLNEEYVMEVGLDITNMEYDDELIDINEFKVAIEDAVAISCEDAMKKMNITMGILDYFVSEGIQIGDLVEAGMELCEGVEVTEELKEKLEKQIFKSLTDINVIALLMAAIRTEEDFQNGRVREVDVSTDPAYLYTDEVLGLAISNQIAGTKATFNFKRYDEAKPGILYGLGPMIDDIFAGLIAGCMSKIFEE